ncbi:MAG: hypothetical protein RQ722_03990 [Desulfuromonadales bacterium]|nr:hypothetical protein [Desulfuromonadales bacterium]
MVSIKRKFSLKNLLILSYALTVVVLSLLLVSGTQDDQLSFSLSQTSIENAEESETLAIYGEDFHAGIRGLSATSFVNEDALLWHQLIGIQSTAIDVKDDLALIACYGKTLVSIGLHDDKNPEILDSLELPDSIRQIKIAGDQALVSLQRHSGVALIDVKDPGNLKLVRHYPLQGLVLNMVVAQDTIYYSDLYQGVGRLVLSAKNSVPELLVPLESPWRMALQDNKLVVGTVKDGVYLFDITQGGQLIEAGRLDYPDVRGVAFSEEVLAVVLADDSLQLFDLLSWPVLNDSVQLKLPASPMFCERIPGQAGFAVSLVASGMALVDVSRPHAPTISGFLKMPETFIGMKIQSGKAYGVNQEGLQAFSLDKIAGGEFSSVAAETMYEPDYYQLRPWHGRIYGFTDNRRVDFGRKALTESFSPGRFLAITEKQGVSLFEKRENSSVQRVGSMILKEAVSDAIFKGDYLYIAHQDGLRIYSGSRPEELVVMSDLKLPGRPGQLVFLDSAHLLVATRDNGMLVIDVNDPQRPQQIAHLVSPRHLQPINILQDVLVNNTRAYLSQHAGGVHIVDISSPSQPELLQIIDTPGHAKSMVLYDNLLLVAIGNSGLFMIDVNNDKKAMPIGTLPIPLRIDQIAVADNRLIVSGLAGGTMRLPLPQRMKNLQRVSKGELRVDIETAEKGQYLYLYDEVTSTKIEIIDR